MKAKTLILLFVLLIVPFGIELLAQCPMCRMAAESNLDNGGTEGRGLNTGILYLFSSTKNLKIMKRFLCLNIDYE